MAWRALFTAIMGLALCNTAAFAAEPSFAELVVMAEKGEPVDYTALRLAYTKTDSYDPYGGRSNPLIEQAWAAFGKQDCKTTLAKSDEILKIDYTSAPTHLLRAQCFGQLGMSDRAKTAFAIGKGLRQSVLESGDGNSIHTAYLSVTLGEQAMVFALLDARKKQQTLINEGGHHFDLIEGIDAKSGASVTVYFNVDHIFNNMARMMGVSLTRNPEQNNP